MTNDSTAAASDGAGPYRTDDVMATLAHVCAARGDALAVAVLAEAAGALACHDEGSDFNRYYARYALRLELRPDLWARLDADRETLEGRLAQLCEEITRPRHDDEVIDRVHVMPALGAADGWRAGAKAWLRGEGITNQGRVRSDNIAARQHDGLLFRSQPEVHLYDALKARGVYFAPLAVFVRGGQRYQRLEPDFVVLYKGVVMVIEVDGATVHRETPAEAHARTEGLAREGVRVERVQASECETPAVAGRCAERMVQALERYRELRV